MSKLRTLVMIRSSSQLCDQSGSMVTPVPAQEVAAGSGAVAVEILLAANERKISQVRAGHPHRRQQVGIIRHGDRAVNRWLRPRGCGLGNVDLHGGIDPPGRERLAPGREAPPGAGVVFLRAGKRQVVALVDRVVVEHAEVKRGVRVERDVAIGRGVDTLVGSASGSSRKVGCRCSAPGDRNTRPGRRRGTPAVPGSSERSARRAARRRAG